jgi:hypothetical protein
LNLIDRFDNRRLSRGFDQINEHILTECYQDLIVLIPRGLLACMDRGLVDIKEIALKAAIRGAILADPKACFVMTVGLRFGPSVAHRSGHQRYADMPRTSCHFRDSAV